MIRNLQTENYKGQGDVDPTQSNLKLKLADRRSASCYMDLKLQNQLSKFLSPEFDVTVNDVGEIINILNAIKAKCASTPEKFRLLVGLLCKVDLSITTIKEHYEQLLVKNRIFHLLRMFPDVAHPLLDVIARATNRCCPLASLPVTIGRIEEERQARNNKFIVTCNSALLPGTTQLLQHSTCLRLSAQNNPTVASDVTGIQQAGVLTPHRLSVPTPPTAYMPSVHVLTVTSTASQSLVRGNQLTEFDMSRRMYNQVPPSLQQSSLPVGVINSSGARESPTDIQKRILLQQQRHLRQQLEMLQAQRLQQTFEQQKASNTAASTLPNTPMTIMVPSVSPSSAVISPVKSSPQPMRITRSCSQLSQQPIREIVRNSQSGRDIQALDLRSPERRLATKMASTKNISATLNRNCEPVASKSLSANKRNCDEGDNVQKENGAVENEGGLCLSQVGQNCIMVSVRDGSNSAREDTVHDETSELQRETKLQTKEKPKKEKSGHKCRGAVINVKKLCHMKDAQKSKNHKNKSTTGLVRHSPTAESSGQELKRNTQRRLDGQGSCLGTSSRAIVNNNNNNNKCHGNLPSCSSQPRGQNSSKKRKSQRTAKSTKRRRKSNRNDTVLRITVSDSQTKVDNSATPFEVGKESVPLDLSCTLTPTNNTRNMTATDATFEPTSGLWLRKPKDEKAGNINHSQHQGLKFSQNLDVRSPESADLMYSGCDEEAWYQSSQSEEFDILSNQSLASPAASQSNVRISSQLPPWSFSDS